MKDRHARGFRIDFRPVRQTPVTHIRVPDLSLKNRISHTLRHDLVSIAADELRHEANPVDDAVHACKVPDSSGERVPRSRLRKLADHDLGDLVLLDNLALARALNGVALRKSTAVLDERALRFRLRFGGGRVAAHKAAGHLAAAEPSAIALELAVRVHVGDHCGRAILEKDAELVWLRVGEVQEVCSVSVSGNLDLVNRCREGVTGVGAEEGAVGVCADGDAVAPRGVCICAAAQDLHLSDSFVTGGVSDGAVIDFWECVVLAWLALIFS